MNTKDLRVTYSNPTSGLRTVELSADAERAAREFLAGRGKSLEDTARRGRRNARGRFTFKCGVGYAVVDADLFGGSGDGQQERDFWDFNGRSLSWQ